MRIGVYAQQRELKVMRAFIEGAERLKLDCITRNPAPFTPSQMENFDLVVVWGDRLPSTQSIITEYNKTGVKVLVMELGFFLRTLYYSIGINQQYWIPVETRNSDRWEKLKLNVQPYKGKSDGYILICSQTMSDKWELDTERTIRTITDRKTVIRRHPVADPDQKETLAEQLKGAYCVVCDTSNVGNEAILAGIPVFCSPNAMYANICNTDLTKIEKFKITDLPDRIPYFHRLAYGQWSFRELKSGIALAAYLSIISGKEVPAPEIEAHNYKTSVITCTGDRPEAFKLCAEYLGRQTVKPDEWVVVDDGVKYKVTQEMCEASGVKDIKLIHRARAKDDPNHTLTINMLEALDKVTGENIIIMEDDDWYAPNYIETMIDGLMSGDLCGTQGIYYWNIPKKCYQFVGKSVDHASLCQTAFRRNVIPVLEDICKYEYVQNGIIDISIWEKWKGSINLMEYSDLVVGIKGLPGRPGMTSGHLTDGSRYNSDPKLKELKKIIKNDVAKYASF